MFEFLSPYRARSPDDGYILVVRAREGKFLVRVPARLACPEIWNWNLTCRLNLTFGGIFLKKILSRHGYLRRPRTVQVSDRNVQDTTASRNNQPDCPLLSTGSCIPPQIPRKPTLRPQNIDPVTIEIVGKFMFDNTKCSKFRLRRLRCKIHSLRFGGVWGGCRVDHTWKPNNSRKKQSNLNLNPRKFQINVLNTIHKVTLTNNLNTV